MTPPKLTEAQIQDISVDTWLKNGQAFATNIDAYTAIGCAIETKLCEKNRGTK